MFYQISFFQNSISMYQFQFVWNYHSVDSPYSFHTPNRLTIVLDLFKELYVVSTWTATYQDYFLSFEPIISKYFIWFISQLSLFVIVCSINAYFI